ncbi:MAG: TIGR03747 family integrating conjugative element membrane protein [Pelagibaca sp.]|jgi:integrating conjugative element membrane protein (TIGR03747 family)|nr:TIGR03747 family integrating conjugative element membrane protein [Pelagibaca sp.]MBN56143.1 TIGR03747 family integrating conjugative element membrane protein [Oceanospirillaceae bacterium]|tara:strand:+ start:19948 stop:20691 length:744 start_codon:yes stop_codon:yes gene_type:complete
MAESSVARAEHPVAKKGFIGKTLDLIFKVIGLLLFSALMSIIIEWIGMVFFYPEQGYTGYEHAEEMMRKEISYLGSSLDGDSLNGEAVQAASGKVTDVVNFLFIDSGIVDMLTSAKTPEANDGKFVRLVKGLIAEYYNYFMAAIYILIMFLIRLSILVLSIPAFFLFGLVGVSDGLMQRDLRRWCGGNESGYIYHWAKRFAMPILIMAWVIYLAIPSSIHPNFIITPFAVLFGLVLMVMTSKFKKYL